MWFLHVERMDEHRIARRGARRMLISDVSGLPVRDRPWFGWMDGVRTALGSRGMTVEAAR